MPIGLSTTLNPFDSECFRVAWSEHDGSSFSLAIPAQPGHQFSLWTSTILAADSWQRVDDAILTETADGVFVFTDPNPDATREFYRIQLDSTP